MASVKIPEQKVILCGEYGVGKSSLFRRFAFNLFIPSSDKQSTLGLDHFNKEYNVCDKSIKVSLTLYTFRIPDITCFGWYSLFKLIMCFQSIFQLQLWDTGGMERVASITSSYYKFAEAAILVFSLDNAASFHVLSQHLLDVVTYAENAKIFLCGNKEDLEGSMPQVTSADLESFWLVFKVL